MHKGKRKILFQVLILSILIVVCISTVQLYVISRDLELKNYSLTQRDIVNEKVHELTNLFQHKINAVELIAGSTAAKEFSVDELEKLLHLVSRWEDFSDIYFLTENGKIISPTISDSLLANSQAGGDSLPKDINDLISRAKDAKKTQLSNFIDIYPNSKGLIICSPVNNNSHFVGNVIGILSLNNINKNHFTSFRENTQDLLFGVSPQGEYIFAYDDLRGRKFQDIISDTTTQGYKNYVDMTLGETKYMQEHNFPLHYKTEGTDSAQDLQKYLSYAPVKVQGNFLFSVGLVTPVNAIIGGSNYYLTNIILFIVATAGTFFGFFKYNRRSKELLISEIALQEKGKFLKELEDLNSELEIQKDAYARLWEETSLLNTELFTKNKSLNEQNQFIETLWEETNALNEELLNKNEELIKLNDKVAQDKDKLLLINTIGEHMVSPSDMTEVLTSIVELIKRIINFSTAAILKYNTIGNTLQFINSIGYEGKRELTREVNINEGLCGYAARNKEIVLVNDVAGDERYVMGLEETKAELDIPLLVKDELIGVLSLQKTGPFTDFDQEQELILKVLGNNIAMVIKNHLLAEEVRESFLDIVKVLVRAIEAKDIYTSGHCERVKEIALQIGEYLDLDKSDLELLELAALLHDIGKIGMPEEILNKKGKLTKSEYELIQKHPSIGYSMLAGITSLERINTIILQHHERIDGTGYPNQLKGEEMDILAKILAVADAVDAMTSTRPYRNIQPLDYVLNQLDIYSDSQFDKKIAAIVKVLLIKESLEKRQSGELKTV